MKIRPAFAPASVLIVLDGVLVGVVRKPIVLIEITHPAKVRSRGKRLLWRLVDKCGIKRADRESHHSHQDQAHCQTHSTQPSQHRYWLCFVALFLLNDLELEVLTVGFRMCALNEPLWAKTVNYKTKLFDPYFEEQAPCITFQTPNT